ncbi:hypothetical protein F2Q69_00028388 [Brassica cretica]|uniref:Uncharacterized protein n=1 Tax=Brassica cretica TaxID=69181 RepID=A0A8S9RXZ6_BRACR|nr:hypothetical protein F2Q69_00028388 [Brassica cretica]
MSDKSNQDDACDTPFPENRDTAKMGLKGPELVARIRAREGVTEVRDIMQQEAEIAELPQRS